MAAERVDLVIDRLTAYEFLEWLGKRDIYLEGPGRGKGGLWYFTVRCLRSQKVYSGSSESVTGAIGVAIHMLLEERKKLGTHLKEVKPKYLT